MGVFMDVDAIFHEIDITWLVPYGLIPFADIPFGH